MSAGTWDLVYGANVHALNAMLSQIGTLSPGLFSTTPAINSPPVEAVMVDLPNAPTVSIQPVAGNAAAASLAFSASDARLLVITTGTGNGFAPAQANVSAVAQMQGSTVSLVISGAAITAPTLPQYQGMISNDVVPWFGQHFQNTVFTPFQLTPAAPYSLSLGPFTLTAVAYDAKHGAVLAFSALTPTQLVLPDPDSSWLPGDAFVGFGPAFLNAMMTPDLVPATSNSGYADPNLSWDYSIPLIADAASGLSATIGRTDLPPSTVLIAFDLNSIVPVTLHTPEPFPNFTYNVEISGQVEVQMRIDFKQLPSPGDWHPVGTITMLDSSQVFVSPAEYTFSIEVDSWSIPYATAMTDGVIDAISNALVGLSFSPMIFETVTVTPPNGPALALNFTNPSASAISGPGGTPMLVVNGDITVSAATS